MLDGFDQGSRLHYELSRNDRILMDQLKTPYTVPVHSLAYLHPHINITTDNPLRPHVPHCPLCHLATYTLLKAIKSRDKTPFIFLDEVSQS